MIAHIAGLTPHTNIIVFLNTRRSFADIFLGFLCMLTNMYMCGKRFSIQPNCGNLNFTGKSLSVCADLDKFAVITVLLQRAVCH